MLRELRAKSGLPGWQVGAEAGMDSGLLSKVENGKRSITRDQLLALAKFFKVEAAPLEAVRIAEVVRRKFGSNPAFPEAAAILQEDAGEYLVNKMSAPANKRGKSVNNPKKKA